MSFYSEIASTSNSLLAEFGRVCQIATPPIGIYNTNTGTVEYSSTYTTWDASATTWDGGATTWDAEAGTGTETSTDVFCADFAMSGNTYAQNTNIQAGDRYALVSTAINSIDVTNKLIIGGVRWNIVAVKTIAPAGENVLYKCHIRK
jgi:hypothetical protein